MPKFMNMAAVASGVLASSDAGASSSLNSFFTQYIQPMVSELGTALIAVIGMILAAMVGFLTVKYGLPIAMQWIRKILRQ